jgi:hypothetical protein
MILARLSVLIAGLAFASTFAAAAPARTNFDGNWSVLIITESGRCDRAYRYGLAVRNGGVFYEGSLSVNVNGWVTNKGQVSVRVSAGSQGAEGTGRLFGNSGSGKWQGTGSSGDCSGTWTAERR